MENRFGHRRGLVALLAALMLLVAACGGGDDGAGDDAGLGGGAGGGAGGSTDALGVADRDQELTFAASFGYNTLDPHKSPNPGGDGIWLRPVYDRLITLAWGDGGQTVLAPQLATSWEVAADGTTVDLELRDDVTFEDGTPFDAAAVKANLERAKGPESAIASVVQNIESVEVVDDTHVRLHLATPDPAILWVFAVQTAGMMINPNAFNTDLAQEPAGSGPFTVVSTTKDGDTVYERREDHWDPDAALVSKLTVTTVMDPNARFNGAQAGTYDIAYLSGNHHAQSLTLDGRGFNVVEVPLPIPYGLHLHTAMAPFDDVRVRRAVSMALNRPEIAESLLQGLNEPAYQLYLEGFEGYDPALDEDPYDLEEAKRLIQEAGAEGATVNLLQLLVNPHDLLAEVVQESLDQIGLNVQLEPVSGSEGHPTWRRGGHHAYVSSIIAQPEPSHTLTSSYLSPFNPGGPPAELVAMATEAKALPLGSDERTEAFEDINAWMQENPIHIPIAQQLATYLLDDKVVGFEDFMPQAIGQIDFRRTGIAP